MRGCHGGWVNKMYEPSSQWANPLRWSAMECHDAHSAKKKPCRHPIKGSCMALLIAVAGGWWDPIQLWLTLSFRSLPGLKWGTYLESSSTLVPVFGFRPIRGALKRTEKLPNPLISIRPPFERVSTICSTTPLTAASMSRAGKCANRALRIWMRSDFVMLTPSGPWWWRLTRDCKDYLFSICSLKISPRVGVAEEAAWV